MSPFGCPRLARFRPELNRAIMFHREAPGKVIGLSTTITTTTTTTDCYSLITDASAKKKNKKGRLVAKAYYGDFTKKDLRVLLKEGTTGKLTFRRVEEDPVQVSRRSAGASKRQQPSSSSSSGGSGSSSSGNEKELSSPPPPPTPQVGHDSFVVFILKDL